MGEVEGSLYGFNMALQEDYFAAQVYIDNYNKRVKLHDYSGELDKLQVHLIQLCKKYHLGKIISTIRKENMKSFIDNGYIVEGSINGFFKGVDGYCASFYSDENRFVSEDTEEEDFIVKRAKEMKNQFAPGKRFFNIRTASENDIESMARLFNEVFKTYPTPMNDPAYIKKVMNEQVLFKVAFMDGKLVSAASADMDAKMLHAEITDCATFPEYRGKGLLSELVYHLEQELTNKEFITLFSLSRGLSNGINIVLSKHGYDYTGRLVNNCNMMGKFEDMNIWVKRL
jgi:beta-lysine N6-acetyltransferase